MKIRISLITVILMFFFSCNEQQEQPRINSFTPKVVKAEGYIVPKDSMVTPKSIPAGKPKVIRAGKPTVVPVKTNIHLAGIPKTVIAGIPKICTPGKDSFSLPKVLPAISRPFPAGIPEMVVAKDGASKDQNAQNFSSFAKLEGLKDGVLCDLKQDKNGNIWIGTYGGGVSRYDGKNFTHFTEKEGLGSNNVWQILEDRSGNIWFGGLGGISEFDGKNFTHYTEKEGLLGHGCWSIKEDRLGNLWFGRYGGVSKYDGRNFTNYTKREGLSNEVRSILVDTLGHLWFGTVDGVSRFDGISFENFTEKEGLVNNDVYKILQDKKGIIWIGTKGGVSKFDGKSFTNFTEKEGLSSNLIRTICDDRSGNLWFGTDGGGVTKYDSIYFTHFTEDDGLANNQVHCIFEDRSGDLWFGTETGLSKYNGRIFTQFTREDGLINDEVNGMTEDNLGNLWIGTKRGVSKYDGESFTNLTEEQGLGDEGVLCSLVDRSGNLWFGTHLGGVSKYDGKTKTFTNYTEKEGLSNNEVTCLLQDRSGIIWLGTWGGGVTRYDGTNFTHFTVKEGLSNNAIWNIFEDKAGNLWFGTWGGGVTKYDGKSKTFIHFTVREGLSGNRVLGITDDNAGNIWIGTDRGVSKYDGTNFTHFTEKEGLSNNEVYGVIKDKSGNLWFGTTFGLNKLTPESLLKLSANALGTAGKGVFAEHPKNDGAGNVLFKSYSYEDGFLAIGCKENAIFQDKNGTIWIGAKDRLTAYHPDGDKRHTIAPNMKVTGVALFNENIPWANLQQKKDTNIVLGNGVSVRNFKFEGISKWYYIPEHLSLAHNNNFLTFSFIGITTNSPKKVKYQYILEGFDKNWSALSTRTEAPYGNLPPDNYRFKVKARNSEGYWSKEFIYRFTIRPPWWQTWWFRITAGVFVISLIYGLMRWRLQQKFRIQMERSENENKLAIERSEKEKQLAELQQQKTELEMQALRAQMNPHFIFNSLNSINRFILQNNRTQASEYLTKFSKLVRLILQNSQAALIPLESELESLELYLDLEALRFDHRFGYEITVPKDLDIEVLKVPPLIIQPYAENAIWHGLMQKEEKGQLDIEVSQRDDHLFFRIADDGIGRKAAAELKSKSATKHKSVGLKITADRIAMLQKSNGNESPVTINDLVNPDGSAAGTEVIIKMPILYD